ncbi:MAG TPA: hypothetical protein DCL54_03925 [Alphaproteobacteria bacterium]|nr:hypothetical protein [Alphaproteobacteria bacterium]HAJ45713.1 hypothetical protein [Alphaproteobacteria bacterium]
MDEYVNQLPERHRARTELAELRARIAYLEESGVSSEAMEVLGRAASEIRTLEKIIGKHERREKRLKLTDDESHE